MAETVAVFGIQEALNTFQLRLSYTFLDGRLRVSRDGSFIDYENQINANSLVGDWSVEYLLTQDGKLKVRMYNRTNQDTFYNYAGQDYNGTTGVSFQYTQSFEGFFKEMTRILRLSKESKKEEESDEESLKNADARLNNEED